MAKASKYKVKISISSCAEPQASKVESREISAPPSSPKAIQTPTITRSKDVADTEVAKEHHHDEQPQSNEKWLWDHKEILFMALAQLVIDKNEIARASGSKPILIGKNLDLGEKEIPELYLYYNRVSSEIYDFCRDEDHEKNCTCPRCLIFGFREAGKQAQEILSLKSFSRMLESGFRNKWGHWVKFDFDKLCEFWWQVVNESFFGRKGLCNEILSACSQRRDHYCSRESCAGTTPFDETLIHSLSNLEYLQRYHKAIEDALKGSRPATEKALAALAKAKQHCAKGIEGLEKGIVKERDSRRDMNRTMRTIQDAQDKGEFHHIDPADDSPTKEEVYIAKVYGTEEFIFNLYIVQAAAHQVGEYNKMKFAPPSAFEDLWGLTDAQRMMAAENIKDRVVLYRALLLSRSGNAPPLFLNRIYWMLSGISSQQDKKKPTSLFPSYEKLKEHGRGSISEACASQAIELYIDQVIESRLKESTNPGWDYERENSVQKAIARYEAELGKGNFSLDRFLPPGYRQFSSFEARKRRARAWVEEVIQPIVDWIRYKDWMPTEQDLQSKDEQAYQRVLQTKAIMYDYYTKEVEAILPEGFCQASPEVQRRMAFNMVQQDTNNRRELKILATAFFDGLTKDYGTGDFIAANSPAILSAVKTSFQLWKTQFLPFRGSVFCECEDEDEHVRVETEAVARDVFEFLPDFLESKIEWELEKAGLFEEADFAAGVY